MRKCFVILTFLITAFCNPKAQNLVPNPSFEELKSCPGDMSQDSTGIEKARYWFTTDKNNTPDLFNECTMKGSSAMLGTQNTPPKSGKGYAGITSFSERLEVRLMSPLVKNKTYCVQMYVCNPVKGTTSSSYPGFSFCFSKVLVIKKYIEDSLITKYAITMVNSDSNRSDNCKWKLFSAYYTAKGGEKYFAFGGLNTSKEIDKENLEEYHHTKPIAAYYYFDDVCVSEVKGDGACDCNSPQKPKEISQEDTIIIQK